MNILGLSAHSISSLVRRNLCFNILKIALAGLICLSSVSSYAFDQEWNGGREDITRPNNPPPPPCPGGNCKCPNSNNTASPVYAADGSLVWRDADIVFPTNTRVGLERTYNSFDYRAGLFGRGWVTSQESNIARTYRAVTEGSPDGSPKIATEFQSVPVWLAPHGRRYVLVESATECTTPEVLYFTFEKQEDGGFKQVFEDSQSYSVYSKDGTLLQEYSDLDGVSVYYEYDTQDRLIRQSDSHGFSLHFQYNEKGFVSQVIDQADRNWLYSYDDFGRLNAVVDPDGNTKNYGYQLVDNIGYNQHLLTSVNDNIDDPVLSVTWSNVSIVSGQEGLMRVASYASNDGRTHNYTYSATVSNGQPAVRVVKDTRQIGSSLTIERQTFIVHAENYQILSVLNNTDNLTKNLKYDARGNVVERKDERGNTTQYEYDMNGKNTRVVEFFGSNNMREINIDYWQDSDRISLLNEYGVRETRYTYDSDLRLLSETKVDLQSGLQKTTRYTYHPNVIDSQGNIILGKLASIDGPQPGDQDVETYQYNTEGLITRINKPLDQVVEFSYNAAGQKVSEVDVNGVATLITYDSRNQIIRSVREGRSAQYFYNAQGLMSGKIDELGRSTSFYYNDENQIVRVNYPSGDYQLFEYVRVADYVEVTSLYYLSNDVLISTRRARKDVKTNQPIQEFLSNSSQIVTEYKYDELDDLVEVVNFGQFGDANQSVIKFEYDNMGRLLIEQKPGRGEASYSYDDFDRLISVISSGGGATEYKYDIWGELLQAESSDTGVIKYLVDEAENTTQEVNAVDQKTEFIYDALNRLIQIDYEGSELDVNFIYDEGPNGVGQLTTVHDGAGSSQFKYDDRGLVVEADFLIDGLPLTVRYAYNDAGDIAKITYPSGIDALILYDAAGSRFSEIRMIKDNDVTSVVNSVAWHGVNLGGFQLGNGLVSEYIYDDFGRLTGKSFDEDGTGFQLLLDNQDKIIKQTSTRSGAQKISSFEYDDLGRISSDGGSPDGEKWEFSYDFLGNRLTQKKGGASGEQLYSYQINSSRLVDLGGIAIERDAAGNTLNDGGREYQYNASNRLENLINVNSGIQAHYSYNFQGQRVRKQLSGTVAADVRYIYGLHGELLGEYSSNGDRIFEYIYHYSTVTGDFSPESEEIVLPSLVAIVNAQGDLYYVHTDHLETPRAVSNSSQTNVWLWDSNAFGLGGANEDPDSDGNRFTLNHRFPGQYYDVESGLHYNHFRYYDPATNRYVTSDPIGLDGGLNTYVYAGANSLSFVDPDGLVWVWILRGGKWVKQWIGKKPTPPKPKKNPPKPAKGTWSCVCKIRYAPPECDDCPDRVAGLGATKNAAQNAAKNTAPVKCRPFYGHCECHQAR